MGGSQLESLLTDIFNLKGKEGIQADNKSEFG